MKLTENFKAMRWIIVTYWVKGMKNLLIVVNEHECATTKSTDRLFQSEFKLVFSMSHSLILSPPLTYCPALNYFWNFSKAIMCFSIPTLETAGRSFTTFYTRRSGIPAGIVKGTDECIQFFSSCCLNLIQNWSLRITRLVSTMGLM